MSSQSRRFKSLRSFVHDGLWASVCEGVAESNFSPFAVALEAGASEIGLLSSLQQLLGCWLQLWSERCIAFFGSRKRLVLFCVSAQCALLALMIAGAALGRGLAPFIGLVVAYSGIGGLSGPAWNAWVSDLLPARRRGLCFAIRNQRTYPASFVSLVGGGLLLDKLGAVQGAQVAFCAVFLLGLGAKISSLRNLIAQQEHAFEPVPACDHGPLALVREARHDLKVRRIAWFYALMGFAVNLAGPFQAPFLLKTVGFSYLQYAFLLAVMAIARFLAAPHVGRLVDRYGSRRLLGLTALALPLVPFGWCLFQGYFPMVGVYFASGIIWAAFDLCSFTYLAECMPAARRTRIFTAKQVSWNASSILGAGFGAWLLQSASAHHSALMAGELVFAASGLARAVAAIWAVRIPHLPATAKEMPVAPAEARPASAP